LVPIALVAETEAEIETAQQQANLAALQSSPEGVTTSPGQMADISATVETPDSDTCTAESPNGANRDGRIMVSPQRPVGEGTES